MADAGLYFMNDLIALSAVVHDVIEYEARVVQVLSAPHFGYVSLHASPALFGAKMDDRAFEIVATASAAEPYRACSELSNHVADLYHQIVIVQRSDCMFETKLRNAERTGAVGVIVVDSTLTSDAHSAQPFAMSGDNVTPRSFTPSVFLHGRQAHALMAAGMGEDGRGRRPQIRIGIQTINPAVIIASYFRGESTYATLTENESRMCKDPLRSMFSRALRRVDLEQLLPGYFTDIAGRHCVTDGAKVIICYDTGGRQMRYARTDTEFDRLMKTYMLQRRLNAQREVMREKLERVVELEV